MNQVLELKTALFAFQIFPPSADLCLFCFRFAIWPLVPQGPFGKASPFLLKRKDLYPLITGTRPSESQGRWRDRQEERSSSEAKPANTRE